MGNEDQGSVSVRVLGSEDEDRAGIFKARGISEDLDGDREPVEKGVLGEDVTPTNSKPIEDALARQTFRNAGALLPPFDPETLCRLLENSTILRPNIDSYVTNIDAFGHRLEPVLDLENDDVDEKISAALILEDLLAQEDAQQVQAGMTLPAGSEPAQLEMHTPNPAVIEAKKAEIRVHMLLEEHRLNALFNSCSYDMSFVTLRRRSRMDLELMGNAYWEVLRDKLSRICQFSYLYGFTIRLVPLDREMVEVQQRVQVTPLKWETRKIKRRFRRFVQVYENQVVYFKEFGDPRVINSRNGMVFKTLEELTAADPSAAPATEILHFKIHSPRSPYGVPRWAGALLAVLGSRQADEVNFLYFENKAVPPLALLVSGGRISTTGAKKIEDTINERIKGRKNFHNILIIEGEPASSSGAGGVENIGRMKIELKPLTDAMQKDALFMNYGERNGDVVGQNFRLGRLLRGDIRDFNRATAQAVKDFTEEQVFHPEREEFDWEMDQRILNDLGIRYWRFRSNAPPTRDPERLAAVVAQLCDAGVLTPAEAREISADVFNRALKRIRADWTKQPLALTVAGIPVQEDVPADPLGHTPDDPADPAAGDPNAPAPGAGLPQVQAVVEALRAQIAGAPTAGAMLPAVQAYIAQLRTSLGKGVKLDGNTIRKMALARRKATGQPVLDAENLLVNAVQLMEVRDALAAVEQAAVVERFKKERAEELPTEVIRVDNIRELIDPGPTDTPAPTS